MLRHACARIIRCVTATYFTAFDEKMALTNIDGPEDILEERIQGRWVEIESFPFWQRAYRHGDVRVSEGVQDPAHRAVGVLEDLPGLLVLAHLLQALPLQVGGHLLLLVPLVVPLVAGDHGAGLLSVQEDCGQGGL